MVENRTTMALEHQSSVEAFKPPQIQNRWFIFRPKLIGVLLLYKALVVGMAFWYAKFAPGSFSEGGYQANFHRHEQPGFAERFSTWDGEHYLFLSEHGYQTGSPSAAFYPLWPGLIRVATPLAAGHSLVAALILANAFSLVAWLLFHHLVSATNGESTANLALAFLLAYPGALFYQFPYSESLFLLLIMLFFIGLLRENYWLVASTGFLLPLTRATGIFCLLPLAWHLWEKVKIQTTGAAVHERFAALLKQPNAPVCAAPLLGYASYFGVMRAFTGNPFEGFEAQRHFLNQPSISNILDLPGFLAAFFHVGWRHGMADSPIDRGMFVLFALSLPFLWRWNKLYFWYALASGVVPAMSNRFFSYSRLVTLCFPLFIVLGEKLKPPQNRPCFWYAMAVLGGIQIGFIIHHVNFRWAG